MAPSESEVGRFTDKYFTKTRQIVERFGDCRVTYAVFMRRPVLSTPRLAVDWLRRVCAERRASVEVEPLHAEGDWVGAGEPLMYLHGPFRHLVDLETVFLQRLGPACVAAYNRSGIGKALYKEVITQGKKDNVNRIEWAVLDWNTTAIDFYEKSGAKVLNDWRVAQMDKNGIDNFLSNL